MADDQEGTNDVAEEGGVDDYDGNDANDGIDTADLIETTTTTPPAPNIDDGANSVTEDYADDEPIPDFTVKLIINDLPEGAATDIVNAVITDEFGNVITTTPWRDAIDGYATAITQEIQDGISGNGTDIGGKSWWGTWSWHKSLVVALIALCIIGIIVAVIFLIIGRRKPKNTSGQSASSEPTKKGKKKGVTQDPKYSAVPTNV